MVLFISILLFIFLFTEYAQVINIFTLSLCYSINS